MDTNDFSTALTAFVAATQARLAAHYAAASPSLLVPVLSIEPGSKNVRIVVTGHSQRSVFCFVRKADGAVLKADGWKKPAKHARGSIYVNAGQDAVNEYGANYLR